MTNAKRPRKTAPKPTPPSASEDAQSLRRRVTSAWVESVTHLIDAPPRAHALIPLQERCAALGYQLGYFPLAPDPDIEWRLGLDRLLIRPSEPLPEDAEIDREFSNGDPE